MCTAISYVNGDHYFGRNLYLEYSFQDKIKITPRKHPFSFLNGKSVCEHYAMIGTAYVCDHYPLYYDAANEMGLCAAGLNFEGNAVYAEPSEIKENGISPYELIPFLLSCCASVADAIEALTKISIVAVPFSQDLPLTP